MVRLWAGAQRPSAGCPRTPAGAAVSTTRWAYPYHGARPTRERARPGRDAARWGENWRRSRRRLSLPGAEGRGEEAVETRAPPRKHKASRSCGRRFAASRNSPHRGSTKLYAITCRQCGAEFWIHESCFRGHAYCSERCRVEGREETARRARKRLRDTAEGREDHRDAERDRRARERRAATRVADQTSKNLTAPADLAGPSEVPDEAREHKDPSRPGQGRRERMAAVVRRPTYVMSRSLRPLEPGSGCGTGHQADRVCIVCGLDGGEPVPLPGRLVRGHARGPPGAGGRRSRL